MCSGRHTEINSSIELTQKLGDGNVAERGVSGLHDDPNRYGPDIIDYPDDTWKYDLNELQQNQDKVASGCQIPIRSLGPA